MKRSFEPSGWFEPTDATDGSLFEPDGALARFTPDAVAEPEPERDAEADPEILAAAAAAARQLREDQLRDDARREGREQGYTAAIQELAPLARVLERAAERLDEERSSYLGAHRRAVVELAVAIAERLIGRELTLAPDLVARRVQTAIEGLTDGEPVLIQLNAEQFEVLEATGASAFTALRETEQVRIEPRDDVARDDFRVTSGATAIDGRLAPALERVRESLADLESADSAAAEETE